MGDECEAVASGALVTHRLSSIAQHASHTDANMERATIRIDPADPSPKVLKAYFAEVFASLDENPRQLLLAIYTANERDAAFSISIVEGEPVFHLEGCPPERANFRGRWIALHPSPLMLAKSPTRLVLSPTTGNRVFVRFPTFLERVQSLVKYT